MIVSWYIYSFSVVMLFKLIMSKCIYKANPTNLGVRFIALFSQVLRFLHILRNAFRESTFGELQCVIC